MSAFRVARHDSHVSSKEPAGKREPSNTVCGLRPAIARARRRPPRLRNPPTRLAAQALHRRVAGDRGPLPARCHEAQLHPPATRGATGRQDWTYERDPEGTTRALCAQFRRAMRGQHRLRLARSRVDARERRTSQRHSQQRLPGRRRGEQSTQAGQGRFCAPTLRCLSSRSCAR